MKTIAIAVTAAALFHVSPASAEPDAKATYQDIDKTLGLVPSFLKAYPEEGIAAAWDELKTFQMNPQTALSSNTSKEAKWCIGVLADLPGHCSAPESLARRTCPASVCGWGRFFALTTLW